MSNQNHVNTTIESMSSDMTHTPVRNVTFGLKVNAMSLIANSVANDQLSLMNPNPTCENNCAFEFGASMTTAMYFPPTYDKHGNNLNPDGNHVNMDVTCQTCSKKWSSHTQYGKTEFKQI